LSIKPVIASRQQFFMGLAFEQRGLGMSQAIFIKSKMPKELLFPGGTDLGRGTRYKTPLLGLDVQAQCKYMAVIL
jgi:hypothetical protein